MKMTGVKEHLRKLRAIRDIESAAVQALLDAGELVRMEALESIREGAIRGIGHIASRPGEAPNADTGELELGIDVRLRSSDKAVEVVSLAEYSAELEFGSSRIAERPFMRPAAAKHKNRVVLLMVAAVNDRIGRAKKY